MWKQYNTQLYCITHRLLLVLGHQQCWYLLSCVLNKTLRPLVFWLAMSTTENARIGKLRQKALVGTSEPTTHQPTVWGIGLGAPRITDTCSYKTFNTGVQQKRWVNSQSVRWDLSFQTMQRFPSIPQASSFSEQNFLDCGLAACNPSDLF